MKVNQKRFSAVEILIVIVVVGLLGAVSWLVYDRQKSNADNKNSNQFSATSFSLDTSKLPEGWTVTNNRADVVSVISGECFIEAIKENDSTLFSSKQEEGIQALLAANDKKGSKGHVVIDKGTSTLTVSTVSGSEKVTSYEFLSDLPDGGNPFRYSRIYSIHDGYYVSLRRSCNSEAGFASTSAAIDALIFRQ